MLAAELDVTTTPSTSLISFLTLVKAAGPCASKAIIFIISVLGLVNNLSKSFSNVILNIALLPAAVATAFLKVTPGFRVISARAKLTTRLLISLEYICSAVTNSK